LLAVLTGCVGPERPALARGPFAPRGRDEQDPSSRPARAGGAGTAPAPDARRPDDPGPHTVGTTGEKSYLIPAAEIVTFQLLLNIFDRATQPGDDYDSDWSSIKHNLESSWTTDNDPFAVNQLFHPYTGAIYHGFARSAGLDYWESLGYTFAGSWLWEIAGETTEPSLNDQITTGIGGSFLPRPCSARPPGC